MNRLILGHTHRLGIRYLSDHHLWLNPGSISYRRLGDPDQTAHYATIIDGQLSLKRLSFDMAALRNLLVGIDLNSEEKRRIEYAFRKTVS